MRTQAPKSGTALLSILLFIIGLILAVLGLLGALPEYDFYLDLIGVILISLAWILLFLGVKITGL